MQRLQRLFSVQFRHQGLGNSIAIVEKDVLPNDEFKCITCELECSLCNLQHKQRTGLGPRSEIPTDTSRNIDTRRSHVTIIFLHQHYPFRTDVIGVVVLARSTIFLLYSSVMVPPFFVTVVNVTIAVLTSTVKHESLSIGTVSTLNLFGSSHRIA
jgi:hypothetical protein